MKRVLPQQHRHSRYNRLSPVTLQRRHFGNVSPVRFRPVCIRVRVRPVAVQRAGYSTHLFPEPTATRPDRRCPGAPDRKTCYPSDKPQPPRVRRPAMFSLTSPWGRTCSHTHRTVTEQHGVDVAFASSSASLQPHHQYADSLRAQPQPSAAASEPRAVRVSRTRVLTGTHRCLHGARSSPIACSFQSAKLAPVQGFTMSGRATSVRCGGIASTAWDFKLSRISGVQGGCCWPGMR